MYTHRVSVAPTSRATVICLHERFHQIGLAQNNAPSATIAELINSAYYTRRQQNSTTNNDALRHFIVSDRQLLTLLAHSKRQGLCNDTASVRPSVCLSVCPSVSPIYRPLQQRAAGLLPGDSRAGDSNRPIIRLPHAVAEGLLLWARRAGRRYR